MNINLDTIKYALVSCATNLYMKVTGRILFPVMYHSCANCEVNITMVTYYTNLNRSFGWSVTRWTHDKSLHNAKAQYNKGVDLPRLFIKGSDHKDCPRCYGLNNQGIKGVSVSVHKSNLG